MALKIKLFDNETKGSGSIDLEDGKYVFEIVDVEQNTAKSGRGRLQIRCKTLEGPVVGATAFDWWNLPEPSDKSDSYIKNFWKDATKAWPHIYNVAEERLDETALKGLKYRVTVTHEPDRDQPDIIRQRMKSHRFVPKGEAAAGPVAAAPAAAAPASELPPKFSQPS